MSTSFYLPAGDELIDCPHAHAQSQGGVFAAVCHRDHGVPSRVTELSAQRSVRSELFK